MGKKWILIFETYFTYGITSTHLMNWNPIIYKADSISICFDVGHFIFLNLKFVRNWYNVSHNFCLTTFSFTFQLLSNAKFNLIQVSHWHRRATEGAEFWISCKGPAFLSNFTRLQLIQNSVPSVARQLQCSVRPKPPFWFRLRYQNRNWKLAATFGRYRN